MSRHLQDHSGHHKQLLVCMFSNTPSYSLKWFISVYWFALDLTLLCYWLVIDLTFISYMIAIKVRLPWNYVKPNYQIKYQMCDCYRTNTQQLFHDNFAFIPPVLKAHSVRMDSSTQLCSIWLYIYHIRQTFLTPLLAAPLRNVVLSLHLSPVSHRLKQLVHHR